MELIYDLLDNMEGPTKFVMGYEVAKTPEIPTNPFEISFLPVGEVEGLSEGIIKIANDEGRPIKDPLELEKLKEDTINEYVGDHERKSSLILPQYSVNPIEIGQRIAEHYVGLTDALRKNGPANYKCLVEIDSLTKVEITRAESDAIEQTLYRELGEDRVVYQFNPRSEIFLRGVADLRNSMRTNAAKLGIDRNDPISALELFRQLMKKGEN